MRSMQHFYDLIYWPLRVALLAVVVWLVIDLTRHLRAGQSIRTWDRLGTQWVDECDDFETCTDCDHPACSEVAR